MKKNLFFLIVSLLAGAAGWAQIEITRELIPGNTRPVWVSLSGFTGEAAQVLQFDLYVQGFNFTNAQAAQYLLSGSAGESLTGRAVDNINKSTLVAKTYSGASPRRQAHAFADDFVRALNRKGIAQTRIAFKNQTGSNSEIMIADFDGRNSQPVTRDGSVVSAPTWAPGKLALAYGSYKMGNPDIFHHDLSTGARRTIARYGGSSISPAISPDGAQVAMILSKDGWVDLYVDTIEGSGHPRRLTRSKEDESSPCWSPDGKWICFAAKTRERRSLCKVPASGGEVQRIPTSGVLNPTEPDWSPDGKWIVFTSMMGGFEICVVPSQGGEATQLVAGEDPCWAPNSRTVVYARRQSGGYVLSLLDVPTKQFKDVSRIPGSSSQPSWAK